MSNSRDLRRTDTRGRLRRAATVAMLTIGILALIAVALLLAGVGGGEHGPGRHQPPDQNERPTSGHTPPPGMHG